MSSKKRTAYLFGFGFFAFLVFSYFLFPLDLVVERAFKTFQDQSSDWRIEVSKVFPSLFFDTELENVAVFSKNGEAPNAPLAAFREVTVNPHLFAFLGGGRGAIVELFGKRGSASVDFSDAGDRLRAEFDLDGLETDVVPYLKEVLSLIVDGRLYGHGEVDWDKANIQNTNGGLDIEFRDMAVRPPSKLDVSGFELVLPLIKLSGNQNSYLRADIEKGQLKLKQFDLVGEQMELSLSGRVKLHKKIEMSRMRLNGKLVLSDDLIKAIPILSALEKQKDKDGSYRLSISGSIDKPSIRIGRMQLPI